MRRQIPLPKETISGIGGQTEYSTRKAHKKVKIFFADQQKQLSKHLLELKSSGIIPYQESAVKHKVSRQIIPCRFSEISFESFFDYKIFPSRILTAHPQWAEENRGMQAGDTIVQQINIPPFSALSQRFVAGVRIKEVFNRDNCKGFSYETLKGHIEKGISIFKIEPEKDFSAFTVETYSAPAISWLKPLQLFSSLYQDYCTQKAILNTISGLKPQYASPSPDSPAETK